mmetsp:Transcript_10493/g.21226  ORF Transcript_10493/g.21226 Transcript_10493/m.21226 type:complete len:312 (+) Transcript_10493:190-1125(+)
MSNSAIRSLIRTQKWKDALEKINEAPNEVKLKGGPQMNYILHEAVTKGATLEVIKRLVEICPKACHSKDKDKKRPIDIAMGLKLSSGSQRYPETVEFLLQSTPEVALAKVDKVMKSNARRRKARRSLDSLKSAATLSSLPSLDSPDSHIPDTSTLTKKNSPILDPIGAASPLMDMFDDDEDDKALTSTRPKPRRRSSFSQRVMALFMPEKRDLEAERAEAEAKAKFQKKLRDAVAKEDKKQFSFKKGSPTRGMSLKDGAMDFGIDTPVEVLAALASLHVEGSTPKNKDGADVDDSKANRGRRRNGRRRRSV